MDGFFAEFSQLHFYTFPKYCLNTQRKNIAVRFKTEARNAQKISYIPYKAHIMILSQTSYRGRTPNINTR